MVVLFFFALTLSVPVFSGPEDDIERHVKSAFVYQFTKFFSWPDKPGDFVIDVVEDEELVKVLSDVTAGKTVGARAIKVQLAKWTDIVLATPDIAVFPKGETPYHKAIIEKVKKKPCLVVGFTEGLGEAGAAINFFVLDGKIRFELNSSAARENSLKIDPNLLKLAKVLN